MRLNNSMRDAFIAKVMGMVKPKSKWTIEKIVEEAERRFVEALPAEVKAVREKYPRMLMRTSIRTDDFIKTSYYGHSIGVVSCQSLEDIETRDLAKHIEAWNKYQDDRMKIKERLKELVAACDTTNALAVALPTLAHLIPPAPDKVKNLPVAAQGLIDDLKKMGVKEKVGVSK